MIRLFIKKNYIMKPMYVVKFNSNEYWCGNNKFDKQIRKAQIFHSMKYAKDACERFKELEPKIIQIEINIIGEVK